MFTKKFLLVMSCILLVFSLGCSTSDLWFPYPDLYDDLFFKDFNIKEVGRNEKIIFKIKYNGGYKIGILFQEFKGLFTQKEANRLKLRVKIDFFIDGTLSLTKYSGEPVNYFATKRGSGIVLLVTSSPLELPNNKDIVCEVEVLKSDPDFFKKYGAANLFMSRISEK